MDEETFFERLIYHNEDKFYQLMLTLGEFRGRHYINLRKYFQSYEGEFIPSKEGISMEASMENIYALVDGLLEMVSQAEGEEIIARYANNLLAK